MTVGGTVMLKRGREKPVRRRHPWIFSGAVAQVRDARDGDLVDVIAADGRWLARGVLNRRSQIVVRILTWDESEEVDGDFWLCRLERAIAGRRALMEDDATNAFRVVHAESDWMPGLVVDLYGDWLVVQFLTLSIEMFRNEVLNALESLFPHVRGIVERSDVPVRKREGLLLRKGTLRGDDPTMEIEILENGRRFLVGLLGGQKTGFYLDQRPNRAIVGKAAAGKQVLNAFSYTGGFAVYALAGGASKVLNLDTDGGALALGERNMRLNGFGEERFSSMRGDVFSVLRAFRDNGTQFDMVILDPPKFATGRSNLMRATRGYKDINLLSMKILQPGGLLATFSCSGLVSPDLFQKILFGAALDAGRDMQILLEMRQGCDHPVALNFPQGAYLKGLLLRVW